MKANHEIREGSPDDIELIYDNYAPAVYSVITEFISDKSKAEDVLAKIFSNLSEEILKYEHKQSLLLWLLNLSRNQCIAQLIEDNASTKAAMVNTYVDTLPLLKKTIFALVYFKGLNIEEVATILHLPVSSIENIFKGLPNFSPYLFPNIKTRASPVSDILQSLVQNIIPENDAQRVAALRKYEILHTPVEQPFDRITSMMALIFETPMAFLSLVDEDIVFYKSQVGPFGKSQVNRKDSLCSLTVLSKEPLIIEDALLNNCFEDNPFVQTQKGIRFYAGAPLITRDGFLIGAVCVVDTEPRTFSFKDTLLLTEFAEIAMREIESRHESYQKLLFHEQLSNAKAC